MISVDLFLYNAGWCRLVNFRCKRCTFFLPLNVGWFFIFVYLCLDYGCHRNLESFLIGPKVDDDGYCRWNCESSRKGSCLYGRSARRRTSSCCGEAHSLLILGWNFFSLSVDNHYIIFLKSIPSSRKFKMNNQDTNIIFL